jgi:hypothetical protein
MRAKSTKFIIIDKRMGSSFHANVEVVPVGGNMAVMDYRTRDGLADYGFSIEFQREEGWRVYIIFNPFHEDGGSLRLPYQAIENGRRYVDWRAKLDSLGDARTVAALWAELAQRYWHAEGQRRGTPVQPVNLGTADGSVQAGAGYHNGGSVIPHSGIAAKSSRDSLYGAKTHHSMVDLAFR